ASVAIVIAAVAAFIALRQLRAGQRGLKTQRSIDLHRDLTTGEVGAARDRFTTFMWQLGEEKYHVNRCSRPTFDALNPAVGLPSARRGRMGSYPKHMEAGHPAEPLRDLYKV